jgi:hypothetical protein
VIIRRGNDGDWKRRGEPGNENMTARKRTKSLDRKCRLDTHLDASENISTLLLLLLL